MDRLHIELDLRVQHRHTDGSWGTFEPREPHSPSQVDQERDWGQGRIYACTTCDERVRITPVDAEPPVD
jgi:hypothetical protein